MRGVICRGSKIWKVKFVVWWWVVYLCLICADLDHVETARYYSVENSLDIVD